MSLHTYKNYELVDLQKLLDHANIETTMQYVKDYSLDVKKSVEVFNPQKQFTDVRKKNAINRKRKMQ